jgi:hypothetical protein
MQLGDILAEAVVQRGWAEIEKHLTLTKRQHKLTRAMKRTGVYMGDNMDLLVSVKDLLPQGILCDGRPMRPRFGQSTGSRIEMIRHFDHYNVNIRDICLRSSFKQQVTRPSGEIADIEEGKITVRARCRFLVT